MKANVLLVLIFLNVSHGRNVPEGIQELQKTASVENDGSESEISAKSQELHPYSEAQLIPPQLPKFIGVLENNDDGNWPTMYQVNHYDNTGTLGVGVGYHGGVLYPYAHPDVLASLNRFTPVGSLPAVYTTRIREYHPYFAPHPYAAPRIARLAPRDEEQDFLDQLNHDAILPNILPTMAVPMGRSYNYNLSPIGATAIFPQVGSCGIPLLLSCSPNISKGVLGNPLPNTSSKYKDGEIKKENSGKTQRNAKQTLPENIE